jgi:hypothetical protein
VCGALNICRVIYRVRVITPKFGINKRHGQKIKSPEDPGKIYADVKEE